MNNYKIINTHTNAIIKALNDLGYVWTPKKFDEQDCLLKAHWILAEQSGAITYSSGTMIDSPLEFKEITLAKLGDLVAQSKAKVREYLDPNDNYKLCLIKPSDATHWMIEVPDGAQKYLSGAAFIVSGPATPFFYKKENGHDCEFYENDWHIHSRPLHEKYFNDVLWARNVPEQGLISGAEAKLVWANGEALQIRETGTTEWLPLTDTYALMVFDYDRYEIRKKPRTIKLELEIPAPFEPKDGEEAWCLDGHTIKGYKKIIFDDFDGSGIGFWRTEEEIKQVVVALRGIKG